jgi:hypothetical protein
VQVFLSQENDANETRRKRVVEAQPQRRLWIRGYVDRSGLGEPVAPGYPVLGTQDREAPKALRGSACIGRCWMPISMYWASLLMAVEIRVFQAADAFR